MMMASYADEMCVNARLRFMLGSASGRLLAWQSSILNNILEISLCMLMNTTVGLKLMMESRMIRNFVTRKE